MGGKKFKNKKKHETKPKTQTKSKKKESEVKAEAKTKIEVEIVVKPKPKVEVAAQAKPKLEVEAKVKVEPKEKANVEIEQQQQQQQQQQSAAEKSNVEKKEKKEKKMKTKTKKRKTKSIPSDESATSSKEVGKKPARVVRIKTKKKGVDVKMVLGDTMGLPEILDMRDEEAIQNINYLYKQIEDSTLLTVRTLKALFKASGKKFEGQMAASMLQLINEKLNGKLASIRSKLPPDQRKCCPSFKVGFSDPSMPLDAEPSTSSEDENKENVPSNNATPKTSPSPPSTVSASASTSTSYTSKNASENKQNRMDSPTDIVRMRQIQRLESVVSEASSSDMGQSATSEFQSDIVLAGSSGRVSVHSNYGDYPKQYHCLHCHGKMSLNYFDSLNDVHHHWIQHHTDRMKTLPFNYYMTEYATCFHCNFVGAYYELMAHNKEHHNTSPFVITDVINEMKCALCPYIGNGIVQHFASHRIYAKNYYQRHIARMWSPICITDETYDDRYNDRYHHKYKCADCGNIAETEFLLRRHFLLVHHNPAVATKLNAKDFFDPTRQYLCGCCQMRIAFEDFLEHIQNHVFEFSCTSCPFTFNDMVDLIVHDRTDHDIDNSMTSRIDQYTNRMQKYFYNTRMIHGNGLVLTKQNLLSTKYDDRSQFMNFVQKMARLIRFRCRQMAQTNTGKLQHKNKFTQTDSDNPIHPKILERDRLAAELKSLKEAVAMGSDLSSQTGNFDTDLLAVDLARYNFRKSMQSWGALRHTGERVSGPRILVQESTHRLPKAKAKKKNYTTKGTQTDNKSSDN